MEIPVKRSHTCPKLNTYEAAFCGATAGVVARFFTAPLDVVKIRMQLQTHRKQFRFLSTHGSGTPTVKYGHIIPAFKTILREEGIKGLYKGNLSAEYLLLCYNAIEFCVYKATDDTIDRLVREGKNEGMPKAAKTFMCGMVASSVATVATYPLDLLRTRFAMQGEMNRRYTGIAQAIGLIYRTEGLLGFYRGTFLAVIQIMPYKGLVFTIYDKIACRFERARETNLLPASHKSAHDMLSGALSGVISKTLLYPTDVVRRRLQMQGPHMANYVIDSIPDYGTRSWLKTMTLIVHQEGVRSLYKGLSVALVKVAPALSLTFLIFEKTKELILTFKQPATPYHPFVQ
ncbi:mitochondrial carrier domain-containing protein [Dichotomocladium elegans]|nr:mitochondrial carrier domain-containing protein [Dichotomocladium elegans]